MVAMNRDTYINVDQSELKQYADKTDIYLQFMSNYMTWSVYLG